MSIWQEFKEFSREQFEAEYSSDVALIHGNGGAVIQPFTLDSWLGEELIRRGMRCVAIGRADRADTAAPKTSTAAS